MTDDLTRALAAAEALLLRPSKDDGPPITPTLIAPVAAALQPLGVCPLGCAVVMLALAPELSPAIAHTATRNTGAPWPTYALLLGTLIRAPDIMTERRLADILSPGLPLAQGGLMQAGLLVEVRAPDTPAPPWALRAFRLAEPLRHHLLALPGVAVAGLTRITTAGSDAHTPIVSGHIVEGRAGTGRTARAADWAGRSGLGALRLDAQAARQPDAVAAAALTARLERAALVIDTGSMPDPQPLVGLPADVPTALLSERAKGWPAMLAPRLTQVAQTRPAAAPDRVAEWQRSLDAAGLTTTAQARRDVAERFRLSHAAIARATQRAAALSENAVASPETLARAARAEARGDLDGVADRVALQPDWNDLVLPAGARTQLEDFTNAVAQRDRVFTSWGFAGKGAAKGLGLTALFAGISGTGKTMAAAVIAKTLGFDLWQVNLAGLVSKYVGETEKNLDRVFGTAGAADAILFFDEADALFGKRSEVRDSHDRYANIETAFLLQRLEDHDGPVILATNLARNIDAAFLRRLFVMVEFPAPDLPARTALWAGAFPDAAPLAGDVEPEALARLHTTLTGGDIRAAALEAAFLAAAGNGQIDAHTLDTAVQRQMIKRGRLPSAPPARRANGAGRAPSYNGHAI